MNHEKPGNLAASIHRRLLNLSKKTGEDFGFVLTRYALERLLYRLSRSPYADDFVLKGAMLFQAWTSHPHRPTRDVDFLGRGESSVGRFKHIFSEILSQPFEDDAMSYRPGTLQVETMKDEEEYPGLRIFAEAYLGKARISLQVDIGFGDAITPAPVVMDYPTLLPLPAPRLATYPVESVVSEKFEAMVKLGIANSRMKDFFDLWILAREFSFAGDVLRTAVKATFERRKTGIPDSVPFAFTPGFYDDPAKKAQWQAFTNRNKLPNAPLSEPIAVLTTFIMPVLGAIQRGQSFTQHWKPGGSWTVE